MLNTASVRGVAVGKERPRFGRGQAQVGDRDDRAQRGRRLQADVRRVAVARLRRDDDAADERRQRVVGMALEPSHDAGERGGGDRIVVQRRGERRPEHHRGRTPAQPHPERNAIVDADPDRRPRPPGKRGVEAAHDLIAKSVVRGRARTGHEVDGEAIRGGGRCFQAQVERDPERVEARPEIRARCGHREGEAFYGATLAPGPIQRSMTPRRSASDTGLAR